MPKYATVAIDSGGELARLCFSYVIKKHSGDVSDASMRAMQHYPGTTERLNIIIRRAKDLKSRGINVVILCHDDVQQIFGKGGAMAKQGQPTPEPIAVKGWPDFPGKTTPGEVCRAVDNIFHIRRVNGKPVWVANPEPLGPGFGDWEVKDRFNARVIQGGLLPPSYSEIEKLAKANPLCNWFPPYIWLLYGPFGMGKTRSLATFPKPMKILDVDRGTDSLTPVEKKEITIVPFDSEEMDDYTRFITEWTECFS